MNRKPLNQTDPETAKAVNGELEREEYGLELIPSENYASKAVLEALGSIFTNKYAEGYPGKRYYGGCQFVDQVETLAIERAKKLFGVAHVNVQPHSGASANLGVYCALLNPGDTLMGMSLAHGGHLSHGAAVSVTGKWFKSIQYGVNQETELIDYDQVEDLAKKHKPKLIVCGASAYSRFIDFKRFREIANSINAILMADIAHPAGLVATGLFPSPVPYCDFVTSTTHKTLRGPSGGMIMCTAEQAKALDKAIFPGLQGKPHAHVLAAKAVAFYEDLQPEFKSYCEQIIKNAKTFAAALAKESFRIVSGGTDSHLFLIDLTDKGFSGKDAEEALGRADITVNKNTIPRETRSPFITSGIRIGTPAITTRGMKEPEMNIIAGWVADVLKDINNVQRQKEIGHEVRKLCEKFPLYL
ncbi:MAG: serine hydroxymethyltransferase [Deltaproteobacteria bacterium]|nr:serine hydroxymethyltransferase [Deltaproteobacteria bacterium]MBI2974217.1 serine hydroxymethyltransferase [Deltaproteobacteria bacterium]